MAASNEKLRILAVHGYRQTDEIFSAKLGSLRKNFKKQVNFFFAQSPHRVPQIKSNSDDNETTDVDTRGWWFNTEDRTYKAIESSKLSVDFDESLDYIVKIFENEGPFDGILGFSQGASFVSILCSLQQMKQIPAIKFDFAILISGFKSLCEPHEKYYNEKIDLPSLHIFGSTDKVIPIGMAKDLADLFLNNQSIVHEGGHYVPSPKSYYSEFFNKMYTAKLAKISDKT